MEGYRIMRVRTLSNSTYMCTLELFNNSTRAVALGNRSHFFNLMSDLYKVWQTENFKVLNVSQSQNRTSLLSYWQNDVYPVEGELMYLIDSLDVPMFSPRDPMLWILLLSLLHEGVVPYINVSAKLKFKELQENSNYTVLWFSTTYWIPYSEIAMPENSLIFTAQVLYSLVSGYNLTYVTKNWNLLVEKGTLLRLFEYAPDQSVVNVTDLYRASLEISTSREGSLCCEKLVQEGLARLSGNTCVLYGNLIQVARSVYKLNRCVKNVTSSVTTISPSVTPSLPSNGYTTETPQNDLNLKTSATTSRLQRTGQGSFKTHVRGHKYHLMTVTILLLILFVIIIRACLKIRHT